MTPFATVLPRPRGRAAALLAAVAGVAIAVAALVPEPRAHARPRRANPVCGSAPHGDYGRGHCQPAVRSMELHRHSDQHFAQQPPPPGGCRYPVDRHHDRYHRRGPNAHAVPNVPAIRVR